ncbi:DNA modification methylase [Fusobacterium mortiferum]|uniref:Methyltransferase n=1 Tax=Fusobacterium mortiferum TaxID=850 RepID=A0ABS2FZ31_FUSMR|nr:DNA modification methylase [Fusobacterium mortiferum]MBM6874406.1 DNA modification methylase [Fusobacterium mortiferum]
MEILEIKIENIKLSKLNPRVSTPEQIEQYKKILSKIGFIIPIFISSNNEILYDTAKYEAAKQLGFKTIKAIRIEELPESTLETLRVAEMKAFEMGEWDNEVLYEILANLDEESRSLTGFDFDKLKAEIDAFETIEEIEEIDTPEIEEEYFSKPGDIYLLGNHRLMCGDSTKREDVEKLVDGATIDLMITDPPYNVNYESTAGKIKNDNMSSNDFYEFLKKFYANAFSVMRDGAAFYIFHADSETKAFRGACEEVGFKISQCLIWVKNAFNLSMQDYHWRHEPCLYGWKLGTAHYFITDRSQDTILEDIESLKSKSKAELLEMYLNLQKILEEHSTIIRENKPLKNDVHPTMKPLKLLARLMVNSSQKEWNILDLFGGSGSTMMTAEQLGRKSYLMEYDPRFADVIVKRFASVNKNITLLRDGKEYSWNDIKSNFGEIDE